MRTAGYIALLALSIGVAAYALVAYSIFPLGAAVHPEMRTAFAAQGAVIYLHVFGSAAALLLGPFQFLSKLRITLPRLHRWMGRVYLGVGVLVGAVAGLLASFHAFGGPVARFGFACLAVAWLFTGVRAYMAIRAGDTVAHRRWMVRNFALAFGAVTLRLWLPAGVIAGMPFELAYPMVAWLCWVPNLLVAEWMLGRPAGLPAPTPP